ncbi:hypothetical protein [Porphyromonas asaccharolytica]|uniref:Uncharacterized protein n=1 Tax=Porphyromonas asaccharolytica (strain ATCC 25260 / DSM 20707 / BCRC 10618 / CCUG 7834 / JCM 6326 / LMG 13178 / VPI 4198 / B440) TaxID=879243 RepID=F4KN77_PORAD|nr:hypothetical protein [Porphyromonas asaccharolytica]AEE12415.1 hypothetical protein Poras_0461 [Porphyromonas asaccharolytica DSM 20707]
MIQRYKTSLPAPLALLVSIVVCQLCTAIQWYLGDSISFQVNKTMALVPLVANDLALVATLVLSDRIAIQLLLITPRQRSLLLLLQALLLVPLTEFFTLSWSVWALPVLLISLYLQMLCYNRPDRRQTLTLAGLMMGIAVLLYPPLLLIVPLSLSLLALMKVRQLRAYLAYLCGFIAILWLVLPTLYLWQGATPLINLYTQLWFSVDMLLSPATPFDWIGWGVIALLLIMARIGLESIRGGSHVVTWYRQRALLLMSTFVLLLALVQAETMRSTLLLAVPLVIIPITPWASQLSRHTWRYLLPLLVILVLTMQLLLAGLVVL